MSVLTAHGTRGLDDRPRGGAAGRRSRGRGSRHSTPDEANLYRVRRKATLARRSDGMREVAEVDVHGFQQVH